MVQIKNRINLFLLPLASCGFSVAQPIYNLLLSTPVFLVARQNTIVDIWALAAVMSLVGPVILALPGWLAWPRWPKFASLWCWLSSGGFIALFVSQLLQHSLGGHWLVFIALSAIGGFAVSWLLLFSRWQILIPVLTVFTAGFAAWFLWVSMASQNSESVTGIAPGRLNTGRPLPDIVFIVLDELPLATLLDDNKQVDGSVFPGFARLQSMSNWYYNTTSVSDGTGDAVPAILTGRYPDEDAAKLTVAGQPVNIFTLLGQLYRHNVAEAVTRMCPNELCPRSGPGMPSRFGALLLDLSAIYLHRIVPDRWVMNLPNVTNNWSGFFADRQVFFPEGWLKVAGEQTEINRPDYFNKFTDSIQKSDKPALNFMHILLPHEPLAYFPSGDNYGLQWVRGKNKRDWDNVEWGLISAKQRHYLQTQFVDSLLDDLLNHLQLQGILNDSMIVVVADHGVNFALNDRHRALSDNNAAAMLRVPLFIKFPGQVQGKLIDGPAMTIDIVPTILAAVGVITESLKLDGIDLGADKIPQSRTRIANSYLPRNSYARRELVVLDEKQLDITSLVTSNRAHLKLNNENKKLWQIGPYDQFRGQTINAVCEKSSVPISIRIDGFKELPHTLPEKTIRAFVAGIIEEDEPNLNSTPFLITSNDVIVASGHTWLFNEKWLFFALVEPKYVRQEDWAPRAWLVEGDKCLGR